MTPEEKRSNHRKKNIDFDATDVTEDTKLNDNLSNQHKKRKKISEQKP